MRVVDVRGSKVDSSDVFVETTRPRRMMSEGRRGVQRGSRMVGRVVEERRREPKWKTRKKACELFGRGCRRETTESDKTR
jgi:hypothetical protein